MTDGYDKIKKVIFEVECELGDVSDCDLNDLTLDFLTDYRYYGFETEYNILQLNFPGSSDWCYMIAIPDSEMTTFKKKLDSYPIYFIDFEQGEIKKCFKNYKEFIKKWLPNATILNTLSKKTTRQIMPTLQKLSEEQIEYYLKNPPSKIDIESF